MTRRDFELIASAVHASWLFWDPDKTNMSQTLGDCLGARKGLEQVARYLADDLAVFNDRFDRERFVAACLEGDMGRGRRRGAT